MEPVRCGNLLCGVLLKEPENIPFADRVPCPRCGSRRRLYSRMLAGQITATGALALQRIAAATAAIVAAAKIAVHPPRPDPGYHQQRNRLRGPGAILLCMSVSGMRARLPLVVFILLLIVALLLLGFACACLSDHPMQAIERVLTAIPTALPVVEVWSVNAVALAMLMLVGSRYVRAVARPSPATLQRFLL